MVEILPFDDEKPETQRAKTRRLAEERRARAEAKKAAASFIKPEPSVRPQFFKVRANREPEATAGLGFDVAFAQRAGQQGIVINGDFIARGQPIVTHERAAGPFDTKTCQICWPHRGKTYKVTDPNKPLFPLHPRCRQWLEAVFGFLGEANEKAIKKARTQAKTPPFDAFLAKRPYHLLKRAYGAYRARLISSGTAKASALYNAQGDLMLVRALKVTYGA